MRTKSALHEITVKNIKISELCIRKIHDEETLTNLSQSISETGLLSPIIVKRAGEKKYELIIGSRRLKAAEKSGLTTIPAFVMKAIEDRKALEMMLNENLQREDLTPLEEAWAISKLVKEYGLSVIEIAKRIGREKNFIYQRLDLINLPEEIQDLVRQKKLGLHCIDHLAGIDSPKDQIEFAKLTVEHLLSEDELATLLRTEQEEQKKKKERKKQLVGFTSGKICLKIKGFIHFLKDLASYISPTNTEVMTEIKEELEILREELDKAIKRIEEVV